MVIGVEIYKEGFGPLGVWMWRLKGAQSPLLKMSSEHLSEEPHGIRLPTKALSEQEWQKAKEHLKDGEVF